jgi:hypothetical protein
VSPPCISSCRPVLIVHRLLLLFAFYHFGCLIV